MFKRFLRIFGIGRKRRVKLSAREHGNINRTVQLIRGATHPSLSTSIIEGPCKRVPAERRVYGMWCVRSPWHNGAWIGGYYNVSKDEAVTCANPADLNDYDDRVEQHEIGHRGEYKLGISPPWHNPAWRGLFLNWYDMPGYSTDGSIGGCVELVDKDHCLPGADIGDVIEIDVVAVHW